MSTAYGTISTPPLPDSTDISHARQKIRSGVGFRRPWKQMLSCSIPERFNIAIQRINTNVAYFQVNYVIIILGMVFFSLLWHPVSIIVFVLTMGAWLYLYFLRDEPVVVLGYGVNERVILVIMSIFTMVMLLLMHATVFLGGMAVGFVVVMLHGVFGRTNDLFVDEEQDDVTVNLKDTASASYSSPF